MKVAVFGSINMDVILEVERVPVAGENVYAQRTRLVCGGKGENAAIALARLGETVSLCCCVGQDGYGETLRKNLRDNGVDTAAVLVRPEVETGVAYILLEAGGANRIIVAPGANEAITANDIAKQGLVQIREAELVLLNLEISVEAIEKVVALCKQEDKRLVVDAGPVRGIRAQQLAGAYCVSPNETELEALVDRGLPTNGDIEQAAEELLQLGIENVLVKMGSRGCYLKNKRHAFFFPAYAVQAVDTTAAGDSFTAGYCSAVVAGMDDEKAVEWATRCGAVAVTRVGAVPSLPTRDEVEHFDAFYEAHKRKDGNP